MSVPIPTTSLLSAFEQIVLPAIRSGSARIVPCSVAIVEEVEPFSEAYTYAHHQHTYFEWFWLLDNSAHMRIDGQVYQLRAGDACFLPPAVLHADLYTGRSPSYRSLWFSYQGSLLHSYIYSYDRVGAWHVEQHRAQLAPRDLDSLLMGLKSELNEDNPYKDDILRGLLLQLGVCLGRQLQQNINCPAPNLMPGQLSHRVLLHLEKSYDQELTLQDIARIAYLSPNYMASLFKRETGQTIFEALTEIRLRHAKRLLLEGSLSSQAIARAVGYRDASHFSHVFTRHNGVSPGRYGKHPSVQES